MYYTTIGLGGPAREVVHATTEREIIDTKADVILGGGSNIIFPDDGIDGTVLHIDTLGITSTAPGRYTVAAGHPWDDFVTRAIADGYQGVECMSGIPGSAGGTPIQNVGAYGQDISQVLTSLRAYDRQLREVVTLDSSECEFGYRSSNLRKRYTILDITVQLYKRAPRIAYPGLRVTCGESPSLERAREAVLELRRSKGMLPGQLLSVGSFFKNPSREVHAAKLIEAAGYRKGHLHGGVGISPLHVLALINRGHGTTLELLDLAREIQQAVLTTSGISLEIEPTCVGPGAACRPPAS